MKIEDVKKLSPFDRLVYWIKERESIRLKRELRQPWPWTDDKILVKYKFCNVRRMDDKVSQWLLKNWYKPFKNHPRMVVAVVFARHFNLPRSLLGVTNFLFEDQIVNWKQIKTYMRSAKLEGPIFNGAYMVRGIGEVDKVEMVVDKVCRPILENPPNIDTDSMENSVNALLPYWGLSSFMAGQVVADLRWALTGRWKDAKQWAPVGPGSLRGMSRLLERPAKIKEFSTDLTQLMDRLGSQLPINISSRMEAIDYQSCCCEYDKYERTLWGEGKPKQLYRSSYATTN